MERMLAVVFNDESKAYEGSRALNQLDDEGSIAVYATQVIKKNADGTISSKQTEGDFPIGTVGGMWLGSLIGLLGGPVGLASGAVVGTGAGAIRDLVVADVNADFVDDVSSALTPGKYAVVANVNEEWVTPVDTRMEALGGEVFRTERQHFEAEQRSRDVATLKSEIAELKDEHAQARADRKAKLQAKIDNLKAKLQQKLAEAKQRSEQIQNENDAKVQALQNKAEKAQGDAKAAIEARIARMKEGYSESKAKLKDLAA
jgi:uncharacterized membrane protein